MPGNLKLLLENESRFGDGGGMLIPESIPPDSLKRVIINWQDEPGEGEEGSVPWFPLLIVEAVWLLRQAGDRLWCVGEIHRSELASLRDALPELEALETSKVHWLVSCPLRANQLAAEVRWPPYRGDDSLRFLAFQGPETPLERMLQAIHAGIPTEPEKALECWKQFLRTSIERDGLASYCSQARFCVQPDGPHFFEWSLHTRELTCEAIVAAFRTVCQAHHLRCEATWNTTDEYLDFFDLRHPHQPLANRVIKPG